MGFRSHGPKSLNLRMHCAPNNEQSLQSNEEPNDKTGAVFIADNVKHSSKNWNIAWVLSEDMEQKQSSL